MFGRRASIPASIVLLLTAVPAGTKLLPPGGAAAATPWRSEFHIDDRSAQYEAGGSAWFAQTFTTIDYPHNAFSIKLHLCRVGYPGTLTVSIRATDSGQAPTGPDLASGVTDGNTLPLMWGGCSFEWREVTMSPAVNLLARTTYAIVVRATAGDQSNNFAIWAMTYSPGLTGPGGLRRSYNSGATWDSDNRYAAGYEVWSSTLPPNQLPQLSNPQVLPAAGLTTDDVYYAVNYYDPDADPGALPSEMTVKVDYVSHTMAFLMGSPSNGAYLYGPVRLPYAYIHRYSFQFTDTRGGTVCLPASCSGFLIGPALTIPLGDALDGPGLTWTTGGDAPWFGQGDTTHDGVDAASSGRVADDQATWLETTVTGPGTVTFWWKVSSEASYDSLTFSVDATPQADVSGDVGWQFRTFPVGSGAHTLRWEYSKDRSISNGQDAAWVDDVRFSIFTDDPLQAGTTVVQSIHIVEMRQAIDSLRARYGLGAFQWTDPVLTARVTPVKAVHLAELRTALQDAYLVAGRTAPTYSIDPTIVQGTTVVKAAHVSEIRAAIMTLR